MKYKLTIESDDAGELLTLLSGQVGAVALEKAFEPTVTAPEQPEQMPPQEIVRHESTQAVVAAPQMPVTAPEQPATPQAGDSVGISTDVTGLPWDERIHASSRATNADGTWRKRRGVDDDTYNAIEALLRDDAPNDQTAPAQPPAAEPQPEQAAPAAPQMPATAPAAPQAPATAPAAPQAPAAPSAPAPQPEQAPAEPAATAPRELPKTFDGFMELVKAGLQATGDDGNPVITPPYLQELIEKINATYEAHGIQLVAITDLGKPEHEFMIEWVCQLMQNDGKAVLA